MKAIHMIECLALCTAALTLAGGCSENPSGEDDGRPRVTVGFTAPDIEPAEGAAASVSDAPGTKAALAENTTVRVLVYSPNTDNPQTSAYITEQTYYMKGGKLVPCTVNADGSFKAANPDGELSLPATRYDFFAVTPALPVSADHITLANVPNGADLAKSATLNVAVDRDRTVTLTRLVRQCAKIDLVVQNAAGNTSLTALSVTANGNGVVLSNLADKQNADLKTGTVLTPASGTSSLTVTPASFTQVNATKATAGVAVLPRLGATRLQLSFDVTYTISGTTTRSTFTGSVGNLALERGKSYTVTLTMKQSGATLVITDWENGPALEFPIGELQGAYPYIGAGRYVVCKDENGQASFPLHEKWTAATVANHSESDAANTFSAKLEVCELDKGYMSAMQGQNIDEPKSLAYAVSDCADLGKGWRLPTLAELEFIVRNSLLFYSFHSPFQDGYDYWTITSVSEDYFIPGDPYAPGSGFVWVVKTFGRIGSSNNLGYMYATEPVEVSATAALYRCVRDME